MRYFPFRHLAAGVLLVGVAGVAALAQKPDYRGIGRPPTPQEISAADKGAGPSGRDLPPGKGTAKEGAEVFAGRCSMCHGPNGEGITLRSGEFTQLRGPRLTGGTGTPTLLPPPGGKRPVTTLSYYVALPTSIYNAIVSSMPMFKPGSLTADQVYSLTAYILYKNGIIKEDEVMDREKLPAVVMPNRHNYVPEKLEDIPNIEKRACYKTYGVCP